MNKTKGILSAILGSAGFGLVPFFAIPLLHKGMNPTSVLFFRNLFCVIILGIFCVVKKKNMKLPKKSIPKFIFLSILYICSSVSLVYAYYTKFIGSGLATTIHFIYPVAVSLIMIFFFKEKKSKKVFIFAITSLIGVAILCLNGKAGHIDIRGIGLALITVFAYGIYVVTLNKMTIFKVPNDVFVFYVMLGNTIILGLISWFFLPFTTLPDHISVAAMILLTVVSTILPNILFLVAVKNIGPTVASILSSMEPLVAMIIGIIYFHESFSLNTIIGLIIIILSVIEVIRIEQRKNKVTKKKTHS